MTVWGERFDAARDGEEFKQVLNNLFGVLEKAKDGESDDSESAQ